MACHVFLKTPAVSEQTSLLSQVTTVTMTLTLEFSRSTKLNFREFKEPNDALFLLGSQLLSKQRRTRHNVNHCVLYFEVQTII